MVHHGHDPFPRKILNEGHTAFLIKIVCVYTIDVILLPHSEQR